MGNVKGTCVKSVAGFVRDRSGEQAWNGALADLGEAERKIFGDLITANTWYPLEPYQRLLAAIGKRLGGDERELGLEIGRRIIADGLNTVYRIFLGMVSTKYLLSKMPLLWKSYFDSERLEVAEVTDHSLEIGVYGKGEPNQIFCGSVLGGGMQAITLSHGKNVRGEGICCRKNGDPCCKFKISWD
jgi:hypothetical protein